MFLSSFGLVTEDFNYVFRHLSGNLTYWRYQYGQTFNPLVGLVMVGGYTPTLASESTLDGVIISVSAVPDFDEYVYANCLVNVNDTTMISFGGEQAINNGRKIAVHTLGNDRWEVGRWLQVQCQRKQHSFKQLKWKNKTFIFKPWWHFIVLEF